VLAYTDAAIYARTTGYLSRRHADIGSRVKAGQVLAEIDTPEIDQQLLQARAQLAMAKANETLGRTTAERYQD
jgi:multidrug efflux pump subunit AcrA (membrane-fusion protein)